MVRKTIVIGLSGCKLSLYAATYHHLVPSSMPPSILSGAVAVTSRQNAYAVPVLGAVIPVSAAFLGRLSTTTFVGHVAPYLLLLRAPLLCLPPWLYP